ncbi:elongation factor G [bacterium]|nr:elongation factor G [candidate division CSSED10-310 bacterium]
MNDDIRTLRNIGISAHIDAGKTTLTERILYYTQRIHAMHDVRGKDGVGATMDFMELERERGITITSAATHCRWADHEINIIDTPGHVDFTIEVERALRVLDGGILVLCAVGGVQSQSITVNSQMARYNVPCVAFINKCDRRGADPFRVIQQLRARLNHNAVAMQIPIGLEDSFAGVVDLITMQALYFDGEDGGTVRSAPIPDELKDLASRKREELIDTASLLSDELTEAALEGSVSAFLLRRIVREAAIARKLTPVFMGSAYKNKGVQPLLDGVLHYLPSPQDVTNHARRLGDNGQDVILITDPGKPLVSLAFKLEDGPYGQLTYLRVYQGCLAKGDTIVNVRTGKTLKVGRLARMHANQMEEITEIPAGRIGAMFGVECASGDTFTSRHADLTMSSMHVPKPVISLALEPQDLKSETAMGRALSRFTKEDPTLCMRVDEETAETIISGMGELHLDVYIERMRREYGVAVTVGTPRVAYRETITRRAYFDYVHKKQTGGAGQFGRVIGYMEPAESEGFEFEDKIIGGAIPNRFVLSCQKGFQECMDKGPLTELPVTGVKIVLTDGQTHEVDSSDPAFKAAARGAFLQAYHKAAPAIMEPLMKVVVETPNEYQGPVMASLNQRRGMIVGTQDENGSCVVECNVPLAEMFGYATVLRSLTQGKAQFTMEFQRYQRVPHSIAEEIVARGREARHG